MSARTIRRVVIGICVLGVAGMVGGSIANRVGLAISAGSVAAVGIVCLLAVTSAAGPQAFGAPPSPDEHAAADLEARIERLVDSGAEEDEVRSLVRAAVRFGRRLPLEVPPETPRA